MADPSSPLSLLSDPDLSSPPIEIEDETSPAAILPPPSTSKQRKIRNDNKLDHILEALRAVRWGVKDFLEVLEERKEVVPFHENGSYKKAYHSFNRYAYQSLPQRRTSLYVLGKHPDPALKAWAFEIVGQELRKEVKSLVTHEAFGNWTPSALQGSEELNFNRVPEVIAERAPGWSSLLKAATVNSENQDADLVKSSDFIMVSMLCRRARMRSSDKMAAALGIYLYHAGTKRRALDTLAGLGICVSYRSIMRRLERMEELSVQEVRKLGQNSLSVPTYDNFEFQEQRRGERLGDSRPSLRSITTALVIEDRLKLTEPFSCNMWQPEKFLLRSRDMALENSRDVRTIGKQVCGADSSDTTI